MAESWDYPRARGGTDHDARCDSVSLGLSPRSRGNLINVPVVEILRRTIPALAGEPRSTFRDGGTPWDYPRARGGTSTAQGETDHILGLSPRSRGNHLGVLDALDDVGDYPRARGGTTSVPTTAGTASGLSPRSRGNRARRSISASVVGTIPALAGEPSGASASPGRPSDYPRARGGTINPSTMGMPASGLSPRSRGNHAALEAADPRHGTIPALAGEPLRGTGGDRASRDYPRARGGTAIDGHRIVRIPGLSPRSRGNHRDRDRDRDRDRTIPALAGEPIARKRATHAARDYPRARGGTTPESVTYQQQKGLSPRSRGNRHPGEPERAPAGTIPALAGEPHSRRPERRRRQDYPRARGGTTIEEDESHEDLGLSPRSRGNRAAPAAGAGLDGTIPALAGEPCSACRPRWTRWDYPRARGGTVSSWCRNASCRGLSPRSRGNQHQLDLTTLDGGTIPALAGEPRS